MLYHAFETTRAAISPMRQAARVMQEVIRSPLNPAAGTTGAQAMSATLELFIDATFRHGRPEWQIESTVIDGVPEAGKIPVRIEKLHSKPFCDLLHFRREGPLAESRNDPKVLIVAPMSGHYATRIRGTVAAMLPAHDVYVTDWRNARDVPVSEGTFDLDDYTDYLIEFCEIIAAEGERPTLLAVCQPGVPVLIAASLMAQDASPRRPAALVLMGSPIDARRGSSHQHDLAVLPPPAWLERSATARVPWPNRGFMRRVCPGFLQISGFMSMNMNRHLAAHMRLFDDLVRGDGDSLEKYWRFYDEYLAVMDLPADFWLQTIDRVFQQHLLACGAYRYRDRPVVPEAIHDIALMTVEGEKDKITACGQTEAAHDLLAGVPAAAKRHLVVPGIGHDGLFDGSHWRDLIQPQVQDFIGAHRLPVAGGIRPPGRLFPERSTAAGPAGPELAPARPPGPPPTPPGHLECRR